ncbi:hypothetical protein K1719_033129 [Acacia pycnantha]|nr:hypothetical protein K1719_033129 [Acacia pycnantha]
MIPTPGMSHQVQQGMQPLSVNNAAANMPLQQQTSGAMQSTQSEYVKFWEGSLSGQRQGQPVFITSLEGYRSHTASESLASNWPATMQIVRLISQDHMNNKQYVGKADFLVFWAMNPHGFLAQLQGKKLCAVIQLPSQTLLLSVSDNPCRLIGMLFPGNEGQGGVNMNQNVMSGLGPSVVSSGAGTVIPTPGMSHQVQQGMQPLGVNNAAANMPLQQQTSGAMQSTRSEYVKVWEGSLCGLRHGQPVFITTLEGYRSHTASESLALNWPATMQIVRLISQDHMNNKQYVGKADFLVFRAMNPHGFLAQLQEKQLCAVIQLPSQTLLLSVSDKACRLIGMLFPGVRYY